MNNTMEKPSDFYKTLLYTLKSPHKMHNLENYDEVLTSITNDILLEVNSNNKEVALKILKILIENNVKTVHSDIIQILCSEKLSRRMRTSILGSFKVYVVKLLQSKNLMQLIEVYSIWKKFNEKQFAEFLKASCITKYDKEFITNCNNFLIKKIIPKLKSGEIDSLLIEIACMLAELTSFSNSNDKSLETNVLSNISNLFGTIISLSTANNPLGKDLFHFILISLRDRFSDAKVHAILTKSEARWDLVKMNMYNNVKTEFLDYIKQNDLKHLSQFYYDWRIFDIEKFLEILIELCKESESKTNLMQFHINSLLSFLMAEEILSTENINKDSLIDLALQLSKILSDGYLTDENYSDISKKIEDYIPNILNLHKNNAGHWHKLWIILIHLLGKKLHNSLFLLNPLLRIVENAFRNASPEQRMFGFDCWKELIDVFSLDGEYLASKKQIRLILTPLVAKFSKHEKLIAKKFELFLYLMKKLKKKCIIVLDKYLEFSLSLTGRHSDSPKIDQGKIMPMLQIKSIQVFLEILGHSHDKFNEHCITDSESGICKSILNHDNISNHYESVIKVAYESSILLNEMESIENKHTIWKCLWTSLFNLIFVPSASQRQQFVSSFIESLEELMKDQVSCKYNIIEIIFECLTNFVDKFVALNCIGSLLKVIFSYPLNPASSNHVETFLTAIRFSLSPKDKLHFNHELFECFSKSNTVEGNVDLIAHIWMQLVGELDDESKAKSLDFLTWPGLHVHQITDSVTKASVLEHYELVVARYVEKWDDLHLNVLKCFLNILKMNPLLVENVHPLILLFSPKLESKFIMNVTLDIYNVILTPDNENNVRYRKAIAGCITDLYKVGLNKINDKDIIRKLNSCLEDLLNLKYFEVLTAVENGFRDLPDKLKRIHIRCLSANFLKDLLEKQSDSKVKEKLKKLMHLIQTEKESETQLAAKIARIVSRESTPTKKSEKDKHRIAKKNHRAASAKVGSTSKYKPSPVSIDEETSDKFVLMKTEVAINPAKLTDHQKEVLKKRREDIPALYQDISQSVSQSLDGISEKQVCKGVSIIRNECVKDKTNDTGKEISENSKKVNEDLESISLNPTDIRKIKKMSEINDNKIDTGNEPLGNPALSTVKNKTDIEMKQFNVKKKDTKGVKLENLNDKIDKKETPTFDYNKSDEKIPIITEENMDKIFDSILNNPTVEIHKVDNLISEHHEDEHSKSDDNIISNSCNSNDSFENLKTDSNPLDALKIQEQTNSKTNSPSVLNRKEEKPKLSTELKNLKMNIVGGDDICPVRLRIRKSESKEGTDGQNSAKDAGDNNRKKRKKIKPNSVEQKKMDPKQSVSSSSSASSKKLKNMIITNSKKHYRRLVKTDDNDCDSVNSDREQTSENEASICLSLSLSNSKMQMTENKKRKRKSNVVLSNLIRKSKRKSVPNTKFEDYFSQIGIANHHSAQEFTSNTNSPAYDPSNSFKNESNSTSTTTTNSDTELKKRKKKKKNADCNSRDSSEQEHKEFKKRKMEEGSESVIESSQNTPDYYSVNILERRSRNFNEKTKDDLKLRIRKVSKLPPSNQDVDTQLIIFEQSASNINWGIEEKELTTNTFDKENIENVETLNAQHATIAEEVKNDKDNNIDDLLHAQNSNKFNAETKQNSTILGSNSLSISESACTNHECTDVESQKQASTSDIIAKSTTVSDDLVIKHSTQSQDTQTQEDENTPASEMAPFQLQLDLPTKPILSATDIAISKMETASISQIDSEEFKGFDESTIKEVRKNSLEKIQEVTNSVTDEWNGEIIEMVETEITHVENEMNFEVKTATSSNSILSSPINNDTPIRCSELMRDTIDISPISSKEHSKKLSSDCSSETDEPPRKFVPVALKFDDEELEDNSKHKNKPMQKITFDLKKDVIYDSTGRAYDNNVTTPSKCSSKRPLVKRPSTPFNKQILKSPSSSRINKMMLKLSPVSPTETEEPETYKEALLTFERPVPSPLATPRSSILKRKHTDDFIEENSSPCHKRKRVNFSDPCTTSEKIFIKEDTVFNVSMDDDIDAQFSELFEGPSSKSKTQFHNVLPIRTGKPIYFKLMQCQVDVAVIVRAFAGPMFVDTILKSFKSKNIKTIGDLAGQCYGDIHQMELTKTCTISSVYQALDKYWNENKTYFYNQSGNQIDIRKELTNVLKQLQNEKITEETICKLLFSLVDHEFLLSYVLTYFNMKKKQLLEDKNYSEIINHIVNDIGEKKFCDIVIESIKTTDKHTNTSYEQLVKKLEEPQSTTLIKDKRLNDLQVAFSKYLESGEFNKEQFIEVCVKPFINSDEIMKFCDSLSVNEIAEVCANRMENTKWELFGRKFLNKITEESKLKRKILSSLSVDDLVRHLIKKDSLKDVISSTLATISPSRNYYKNDLVEIYKLINAKLTNVLPSSTMMQMSLELLGKIPIKD